MAGSKPSNSTLAEAVFYMEKWSAAMGLRWKELHQKVTREGMEINDILTYEDKTFTLEITNGTQNEDPGVKVTVSGNKARIEKLILSCGFDVSLLPKIREATLKCIEHVETRFKAKVQELPKIIDDFGADVADLKKENRRGRTQDVEAGSGPGV
jgi:hypothetical protein